MKERSFTSNIKKHEEGKSVLSLLVDRFNYYSEFYWLEILKNQRVKLNHEISNGSEIIKEGDQIEFIALDFYEPEVDKTYRVLFEDEFCLAIDKSGDIPVHPSGRYRENNLVKILEKSNLENLYIVNRIDRETSGIVLFGKSSKSAAFLHSQFARREVYKEYIVYVYGNFPENIFAKGRIIPDEFSVIKKKKKFESGEFDLKENAETHFERTTEKNGVTRVLAKPKTGRIHQIRATLFSLGYPIVGDKIYGRDEKYFLEFIQTGNTRTDEPISRQALHSHLIEFISPSGKKIKVISQEPEDMVSIFQ